MKKAPYIITLCSFLAVLGLLASVLIRLFGKHANLCITLSLICASIILYQIFQHVTLIYNIRDLSRQLDHFKTHQYHSDHPGINQLASKFTRKISGLSQKHDMLDKKLIDRDYQYQLLQRQYRDSTAVIYSIRDAVIVTDQDDQLILVNNAARELLNITESLESDTPYGQAIHESVLTDHLRACRLSDHGHLQTEIVFERDNKIYTYNCLISSIKEEDGRFCGMVAILHDMTREKEISRMKSEFVSHVTHELKTPLASISAYAEMLIDGEAPDEQSILEFCSIILHHSERLNRLIDDILSMSRIESNLMKVKKQPLSISELLEDAMTVIQPYASEKSITITSSLDDTFDLASADKDMLMQAVMNLLSNAVKYSQKNTTIEVISEIDIQMRIIHVSVKDQGVGIAPDEIERIFEKFYRTQSGQKFAEGNGLGLNLVKQIVERFHGGRVYVHSTPGQGSEFGFELPLAERAELVV